MAKKPKKSMNSFLIDLARKDFLAFCQLMPSDRPYEVSNIHSILGSVLQKALERHQRGEKVRLILSIPPRHGKTQTAAVNFPAWAIGKNPNLRFILTCYAADLAEKTGMKTRDVISSPQYQTVFPLIRLRADVKSKRKWMVEYKHKSEYKDGGTFTGVGIGGSVTGIGADFIIVDDPHKDREKAESVVDRERVWNYYKSTLYSRLESNGAIILIMQRWHVDDLIGRLLEESPDESDEWEIINFPAIAEEDEYYDGTMFRKKGEPLWKEVYDIDQLANIRANVGPYNWASQYMQDPLATEHAIFKESMFRQFDDGDLQDKQLDYYTMVDPSTGTAGGDEGVVLTVAKAKNEPYIYRIREDAGHYTPKQLIDLIFKHYEEYHPRRVVLESIALQKTFKFALEEEQRKKEMYFKIYPVKRANKEERIRGLIPMYEAGVIFHRRTDKEYELQLMQFPRGKRDDRIDCMSFCLEFLKKTSIGQAAKQYIPKIVGYFENM